MTGMRPKDTSIVRLLAAYTLASISGCELGLEPKGTGTLDNFNCESDSDCFRNFDGRVACINQICNPGKAHCESDEGCNPGICLAGAPGQRLCEFDTCDSNQDCTSDVRPGVCALSALGSTYCAFPLEPDFGCGPTTSCSPGYTCLVTAPDGTTVCMPSSACR